MPGCTLLAASRCFSGGWFLWFLWFSVTCLCQHRCLRLALWSDRLSHQSPAADDDASLSASRTRFGYSDTNSDSQAAACGQLCGRLTAHGQVRSGRSQMQPQPPRLRHCPKHWSSSVAVCPPILPLVRQSHHHDHGLVVPSERLSSAAERRSALPSHVRIDVCTVRWGRARCEAILRALGRSVAGIGRPPRYGCI